MRYDKSTGADGDRVVEAMLRWCAARRGGGASQPQRVCACVSGVSYLRLIISDITRWNNFAGRRLPGGRCCGSVLRQPC